MKHFLILISFCVVGCYAQAQHTIFPKKGIAIQCKIETIIGDTIYFYPDYEKDKLNKAPLSEVIHFSYNETDEEPVYTNTKESYKYDSLKFNSIDEFKWYHVEEAGICVRQSVVLRLLSIIPASIAPFTVTYDTKLEKVKIPNSTSYIDVPTQKPNYTVPIALTALSVGFNIASVAKMIQAGNHLEKAGPKKNRGLSFYISPMGSSLAYKF